MLPYFTPRDLPTRFVLPNARWRRVTPFGHTRMRAWYDVMHADLKRDEDAAGIHAACDQILALIARERSRGLPSERIFLGGFSQGGAISLSTALHHPKRLAGVIALSAYLPLTRLCATKNVSCAGTPVYIGRGTNDDLVPVGTARDRHLPANPGVVSRPLRHLSGGTRHLPGRARIRQSVGGPDV